MFLVRFSSDLWSRSRHSASLFVTLQDLLLAGGVVLISQFHFENSLLNWVICIWSWSKPNSKLHIEPRRKKRTTTWTVVWNRDQDQSVLVLLLHTEKSIFHQSNHMYHPPPFPATSISISLSVLPLVRLCQNPRKERIKKGLRLDDGLFSRIVDLWYLPDTYNNPLPLAPYSTKSTHCHLPPQNGLASPIIRISHAKMFIRHCLHPRRIVTMRWRCCVFAFCKWCWPCINRKPLSRHWRLVSK